jgi:predicted nucleic acid-binding protein
LSKYLLDSDVMIAYLRDVKETVDFIDSLFNNDEILACCSINVTEVYSGMKEKQRTSTEKLIKNLQFFLVDFEIAKMAGNIMRYYRSQGITLGLADTTIAATAIHNNLILITYNKKHYPMEELSSISPKDFV